MAQLRKMFLGSPDALGNGSRQWLGTRHFVKAVFVILVACVLCQGIFGAQVKEVRRVLVFNDFQVMASPGVAILNQAIFAALNESPYQIEWYSETLEATLFSDEASQRRIREWYVNKYQGRKPDLLIAVGPASLEFMVESHEKFFPGIPIIFCGSSEEMVEKLKPDSHFTGVWGVLQPEKTLTTALHLQPATRHVVVVGGVDEYDKHMESIVKNSLRKYESQLEFTYLTDVDMPTLLARLRHLPSDTIVLQTSIMQDAAGSRFIEATQSNPMVASAANAPVFVLFDVDLGKGTVGGNLISLASDGKVAGQMAVRILNGEKPQNIPVVKNSNVNMFDWLALKHWGLSEKNLPAGSIVLNRPSSAWDFYKGYILGGIALMLLEALLISGLLWQRAKRR